MSTSSIEVLANAWAQVPDEVTREIENALLESDDPNTKSYRHEERMQAMQERIDRVRDQPC
ncbi:hypothetical protein PTE30175_00901 [Pandoraea terrae]|uniref:Uncharacterized protein n=1 Tax=Pandoraea terrae TaxID=1537710 RepID=A0A5E4SRM7_9BURK|nr:hypothetical protein [Pandoraea terrae]VVD77781.1 hypothetical protein PTE30175_00901 [Pandoraea terrae]